MKTQGHVRATELCRIALSPVHYCQKHAQRGSRRPLVLTAGVQFVGGVHAVFIRHWLTTNPPLPEPAQAAARAQAGERYDAFVAALGRRLAKGPKVREEISEDVAGIAGAE